MGVQMHSQTVRDLDFRSSPGSISFAQYAVIERVLLVFSARNAIVCEPFERE